MAEYLLRDLKIGVSAIPEATYNAFVPGFTDPTGANTNNYLGLLTTGQGFPLPDKDKQDDSGKIGYGREFPREQRSGYLAPPQMQIIDELNVDSAALLLRRAMGGTDTVTTITDAIVPTARKHSFVMQTNTTGAGLQLPSSSVVYSIGGADYLYGGVVVDSFKIDQQDSNVPQYTASLVGSGLFAKISTMSTTAVGTPPADVIAQPSIPVPATPRYSLGAETYVKWTAGGSTYIITDAQRLLNFSMTLSNNSNTTDRRAGDPRLVSTDTRKGWYVNRLLHGNRSVAGDLTVTLDDTLQELIDANDDIPVTNFTYRARGHYLDKADLSAKSTTNQYTFEIVFPKCYFRNVRSGNRGATATVQLGIFVVEDPASIFGLMQANISTNTATVFL